MCVVVRCGAFHVLVFGHHTQLEQGELNIKGGGQKLNKADLIGTLT